MQAVPKVCTQPKRRAATTGGVTRFIQTALALLLLVSFLMPMYRIPQWKNVSLKNQTSGNGITMLAIGKTVSTGISFIVRKAKLAEGVTASIENEAGRLITSGWCALIGLLVAAALFLLTFTENLGVSYGGKRNIIIAALCAVGIVCTVIGGTRFRLFNNHLTFAAANTDNALSAVTSKLYQGDTVPLFSINIWWYVTVAAYALLAGATLLPENTGGAFRKSLLWFVVPAFCMYTFFVIVPALSSVYLGFTAYDGVTNASMRFVGFDNYRSLFASARFASSVKNTMVIAFSFTILINILALALAMAVDKVSWGRIIFRSAFYLPVLISGIIAGFIWRIMFNYSFGVLNFVRNSLGFASAKFIDIMPNALLSIIFVILWKQVGYYMIIYLAALQGISHDLLEAASIDGANAPQVFRHITIPMLAGSFTINLTLALINGLKIFDEIAILTDGGPGFSTETITYQIYKVAFGEMRQGLGTAMAVVLFLIILVMGGVQSALLRRMEVQL